MKSIGNFFLNLPVLNPDSRVLYYWDIVHAIVIILANYFIPIEWAAGKNFFDLYGDLWVSFLYVSIGIFLLNIVINFNVGFYDQGLCSMNRKDIIYTYVRSQFLYDLVSTLPLILELNLSKN